MTLPQAVPTDDDERELDVWLAEHLFGWSRQEPPLEHWWRTSEGASIHPFDFPIISTSWVGMARVLAAMAGRGFSCGMLHVENGRQHGAAFYRIGASPYPPLEVMETLEREDRIGTAGNAPLPLCVARAAKDALESTQPLPQAVEEAK